jgi:hypothetical protein
MAQTTKDKKYPRLSSAGDKKASQSKVSSSTLSEKQHTHEVLSKIAEAYTWRNIVMRGIVTGIFTAIGATVGIGLLFLFATRLYSGLKDVPLVKDFMDATGLNIVVEYAIEQSSKNSDAIDIGVTDTTPDM